MLILCLAPAAVIISWFQGARGDQVAPRLERLLLAGVAIVAIGISTTLWRTGAFDAESVMAQRPALANLSPTEDPRNVVP